MTQKTKRISRPEPDADKKERAKHILSILRKEFPQPKTALLHENPFQLLIATILSAQCTDVRVNLVTKELFKTYPTPKHFTNASTPDMEKAIRSTGFFRMKARNVIGCSKALMERHSGKVPETMEELVQLPGVGRKTANVVLGQAYGLVTGIVVDTHVHRLAQRMGFTASEDAGKAEGDLMAVYPKKDWIDVGSTLILHGRKTCKARKPACAACSVATLCPSALLS
jgi:endonuclease III